MRARLFYQARNRPRSIRRPALRFYFRHARALLSVRPRAPFPRSPVSPYRVTRAEHSRAHEHAGGSLPRHARRDSSMPFARHGRADMRSPAMPNAMA